MDHKVQVYLYVFHDSMLTIYLNAMILLWHEVAQCFFFQLTESREIDPYIFQGQLSCTLRIQNIYKNLGFRPLNLSQLHRIRLYL